MAMNAALLVGVPVAQLQLGGCATDGRHQFNYRNGNLPVAAAAPGLAAGRKLGGFSVRRSANGRHASRKSRVLVRSHQEPDGLNKLDEGAESSGKNLLPRSAETAQRMTHATLLDPFAPLLVGLALGAAVLSASGGQKFWKRRPVPCFASITSVTPGNSVAASSVESLPPSVEEIKSGLAEPIATESTRDLAALGSSEELHAESGAPSLSIESVASVAVKGDIGDPLQTSARGSEEEVVSVVEVVDGKHEDGPLDAVGDEKAETQEAVNKNSHDDKAVEKSEDVIDESRVAEEDDEDDSSDDEDELEDIEGAAEVQRGEVSGISESAERFLAVKSDNQENSGPASEDPSKELPEEEKELRKAYEEWMAKPYALTVPLKIVGLRSSVPPVWLKDFVQTQGKNVKVAMEFQGSLKGILAGLAESVEKQQLTARSTMAADVVTVGDSWLGTAVAGGLIEPIENAEEHEWYHRLGSRWQALLRRNEEGLLDPKGKIWGVPYRWGTLVVAYRTDKFKKFHVPPVKDWSDLFEPEFEEKVAMVDSPREVVGVLLKSLGGSFNTNDFEKDIPGGRQAVKDRFLALQKQVRLFDSDQYLKALGAGDVWVAVGWSSDVIPFAKRTSNIQVVVPSSGTSLWADLWAIPAASSIKSDKAGGRIRGPSPLVHQWFDFCLQQARALSFEQDVFVGASPLALPRAEMQGDDLSTRATAGSSVAGDDVLSQSDLGEPESENVQQTVRDDVAYMEAPEIYPVEVGETHDAYSVQGSVPEDVIAKSEFLEPLSDTAVTDFQWLLEDVVEVSGWPSSLVEVFKGTFQNFQKWIWSRGIRY